MAEKIKVVETESAPICPHCEEEIDKVERTADGWLESTLVFLCPLCKKVLGVGYNHVG